MQITKINNSKSYGLNLMKIELRILQLDINKSSNFRNYRLIFTWFFKFSSVRHLLELRRLIKWEFIETDVSLVPAYLWFSGHFLRCAFVF